ncbi:CD1247 N-terminal domain-containing protein [Clostridium brassicae]|uniref:Zinc ribbon domain-containing protein n=1 Tax=Clostridium brassicae TaxID=2999072 RepID=A0ABT4DDT7_9CLOT|nr:CD1247 N-terminal domain-containing protein [Clostridium brassicae]MCY6960476.1 hypothetical protein [Clostridium brassicae]
MKSLKNKVDSLRGLLSEIQTNGDPVQFNVLSQMSDILLEITEKIEDIENNQTEINEYVTVLDENLGNIEDELYGFEEEEEEFNSYDYVDVLCEKCNEVLAIEKSLVHSDSEIICPNCRNLISLKAIKNN